MSESNANSQLLDAVNSAGLWFHASKTRPIWARQLDEAERVTTLEGELDAPAGAFLCRGETGDIWPQTQERLEAKYAATDDPPVDGWQKYEPRPDDAGVMAARIDHPFSVTAEWGELTGEAGDYLVKNDKDREVEYPADVWIVSAGLFEATYEEDD